MEISSFVLLNTRGNLPTNNPLFVVIVLDMRYFYKDSMKHHTHILRHLVKGYLILTGISIAV